MQFVMRIDEMKKRKKEMGYSNAKVSELSGVPVGTVQKVFSGETASPRYDTLLALTKVLSPELHEYNDRNKHNDHEFHTRYEKCEVEYENGKASADLVCEPVPAYGAHSRNAISRKKRIGDKTIEDYIALPEGTRVELIDGYFYDMAAPTTIHQAIGDEICRRMKNYVEAHGGPCVPFTAPTDVQLDCDNKTMLQPDVLVVCDRSKITRARIVGAPDLVVEVVSPSNILTDIMIKLLKYKAAGVREYWIVFPDDRQIAVYDFAKSPDPVLYSFEEAVPVGIWDGDCKIDFKKIYEMIAFIYNTE